MELAAVLPPWAARCRRDDEQLCRTECGGAAPPTSGVQPRAYCEASDCNPEDYVAHRSLFGLLRGVGIGTCISIKEKVIRNNLNYRDLFYQPLPNGVFSNREANAIQRITEICARLVGWTGDDTLADRAAELVQVAGAFGAPVQAAIDRELAPLPAALSLAELRELLVTTLDEVRASLLTDAYQNGYGAACTTRANQQSPFDDNAWCEGS